MVNGEKNIKYALILKKFIAGDDNVLSLLYNDFFDLLLNFGLKYTSDLGLVEDCIQNLFVDLLKNRRKLETVIDIKFYMLKSLRYQIAREQMKHKELSLDNIPPNSQFMITYSTEKSIISLEIEENREKFLIKALEKLTSKQKEVLYLKFNNGLSYEQISDMLHIHVSSARTMVYRAIKSIKEVFNSSSNANFIIFLSFFKKI